MLKTIGCIKDVYACSKYSEKFTEYTEKGIEDTKTLLEWYNILDLLYNLGIRGLDSDPGKQNVYDFREFYGSLSEASETWDRVEDDALKSLFSSSDFEVFKLLADIPKDDTFFSEVAQEKAEEILNKLVNYLKVSCSSVISVTRDECIDTMIEFEYFDGIFFEKDKYGTVRLYKEY